MSDTTQRSVRLSQMSRKDILKSLMDQFEVNWFKDSCKDAASLDELIKKEKHRVMSSYWMSKYGQHYTALASLPADFVAEKSFKVFATNQKVVDMCLKGRPGAGKGVDLIVHEETWDQDWAEHTRLVAMKAQWESESKEFAREACAVIDSCNTTKQLLEVWPSCEPFLPAYIADPDRGIKLPALHISRLNERLLGREVDNG